MYSFWLLYPIFLLFIQPVFTYFRDKNICLDQEIEFKNHKINSFYHRLSFDSFSDFEIDSKSLTRIENKIYNLLMDQFTKLRCLKPNELDRLRIRVSEADFKLRLRRSLSSDELKKFFSSFSGVLNMFLHSARAKIDLNQFDEAIRMANMLMKNSTVAVEDATEIINEKIYQFDNFFRYKNKWYLSYFIDLPTYGECEQNTDGLKLTPFYSKTQRFSSRTDDVKQDCKGSLPKIQHLIPYLNYDDTANNRTTNDDISRTNLLIRLFKLSDRNDNHTQISTHQPVYDAKLNSA